MDSGPQRYFVSIGSNINPHTNVRLVLEALVELSNEVVCSRIIQTEAIGFESTNPFLNLTISIFSLDDESTLKAQFEAIERHLGRDRSDPGKKWKDRVADLDIVLGLASTEREIAPALVPTAPYLQPTFLELIHYLGLACPLPTPSLPEGVAIPFGNALIGTAPTWLTPTPHEKRDL